MAKDGGCTGVFVATHDFQAPGFYQTPGFRPVAEIRDKPIGHTRVMMRLSLSRGRAA